MNRTAAGEAKRQVTLAITLYNRLVEKNRQAEETYLTKIASLYETYDALQKEETE